MSDANPVTTEILQRIRDAGAEGLELAEFELTASAAERCDLQRLIAARFVVQIGYRLYLP